jgi:hypothetical protein
MAGKGENSASGLTCNWQRYAILSSRTVCIEIHVSRVYIEAIIADLTFAENNIMVRLPDNMVPGNITTWTAVFLTCTLAVLEIDDEYTDRSYRLDVIKVDAMYKNMY